MGRWSLQDDIKLYSMSYFKRRALPHRQRTLEIISDVLVEHLSFSSFVDMGCALGELAAHLIESGKQGCGVELAPSAFELMPSQLQRHIFKGSVVDSRFIGGLGRFDLAICTEVAEHLREEDSSVLVENLCWLSRNIVFSAAPPGQGGTGHFNEKPWDYWKELFQRRGLSEDTGLTCRIVEALRDRGARPHYAENIRVLAPVWVARHRAYLEG